MKKIAGLIFGYYECACEQNKIIVMKNDQVTRKMIENQKFYNLNSDLIQSPDLHINKETSLKLRHFYEKIHGG